MQVFNLINARKLDVNEMNVFKNFCNNPVFFVILLLEIGLQWAIVAVGGRYFKTYHLTLEHNLLCLGIGASMIPVGFIVRCIPVNWFACKCLQWDEQEK